MMGREGWHRENVPTLSKRAAGRGETQLVISSAKVCSARRLMHLFFAQRSDLGMYAGVLSPAQRRHGVSHGAHNLPGTV